jgi:predicted nuclease of predicted toxin-antitoxin system
VRFYADEGFDGRIVRALREAGADIVWAFDVARGDSDSKVLSAAQSEQRVLLTQDKDFGALVFQHGAAAGGIVLVRILGVTEEQTAVVAQRILALPKHGRGAFTTMDADGERARVLP